MNDKINILKRYNLWGEATPQTGFVRTEYTDKIYSYRGNRLIKVLVGQRRVGKSYILRQLALKLVDSGVDKKNIFFLNLEFAEFDFVRTYKAARIPKCYRGSWQHCYRDGMSVSRYFPLDFRSI